MTNPTAQATRKQLIEDARKVALEGNWAEAITINQTILERNPRDAEAYNRIGRAHLEQHDYNAAIDAYTQALKNDKANIIARRNLQRLELLRKAPADAAPSGASLRAAPCSSRKWVVPGLTSCTIHWSSSNSR